MQARMRQALRGDDCNAKDSNWRLIVKSSPLRPSFAICRFGGAHLRKTKNLTTVMIVRVLGLASHGLNDGAPLGKFPLPDAALVFSGP